MLHVDGMAPIQLGEREWTVLRQADGTRDLEGIRLAARLAGVRVSIEHLRASFEQLSRLGLFDERASVTEHDAAFARDVPVTALPGYRFTCDGSGGCCRQFDTILFAPIEVARARAMEPELGEAGTRPERVFAPERGGASELATVARVEGACLYLDAETGRCRIHAGKPAGCRIFPARFVDVGDAIRVVPRTECACVFERAPDGEPLTTATRGGELPREAFVPSLPASVAMGPRRVTARELLRFFDEEARSIENETDLAAYVWALAGAVERGVPLGEERAVDATSLGGCLEAARASAERLFRFHACWRAPRDLVRAGAEWVRAALARLDPAAPPGPREPEDERLYVRASFFATVGASSSVERELREHALAMWIARAFPDEARARPEARHPLAIVQALVRGHGLDLGAGAIRASSGA